MIDVPIVVWPPGTGWYEYGCNVFGWGYEDCSAEYLSQYPGALAVCCYVL
jgi:hypothetical protein